MCHVYLTGPHFVTEICHTSAGRWRLNRPHDSFRRPATCTLSSSVFLRTRGVDWNRGGAVGVVTGIWAGRRRNRGSILGRSERCVPNPKFPERLWDLSSILFSGFLGFFAGVKVAGAWNGPLNPPNAEVGNDWSYKHRLPFQYALMAWKGQLLLCSFIRLWYWNKSESFSLTQYFFILAGVQNP
jgi:hypothetical protein